MFLPRMHRASGGILLILTVAVAAVLPPVTGWAADLPEAIREQVRTDHDRQAIQSLDFLLALSLDRDQARAALPTYEQACRLRLEAYDRGAQIAREELEAYTEFLAEDRLDQGFSPEVEQRTARAHHQAIAAREGLALELNRLADQVYEGLDAAQRQVADAYAPDHQAIFARFATEKDRRQAIRRAKRVQRHAPPPPRRDPQLAAAKEEIAEINKTIHPREGNVARYLLAPAAAESLYALADARPPRVVQDAVRCWRFGTEEYPLEEHRRVTDALHELQKEINNWNLVNGMHFSPDQIERLVWLADQAEQLRAAQARAKPRDKLPSEAFDARCVELESAAEAVLRPGQREVLATYKPCLLPPKNLKDPVRVGQASDSAQMAGWLERARHNDKQQQTRMIERLIDREIEHSGPMDEDARAARRQRLRETVQAAAAMSDVEFALAKDELARSIEPTSRKDELQEQIAEVRRDRNMPGRTFDFLLNRDFALVLMARHEQLTAGAKTR